ncbi:glycosyltransferase [Allomuricauda sp. SCSIO 65647]|uniref:glycosyltransferase n=1 Tax=Allomuricauda sp. SCSIO 65647 TaxID=2908843 RepID=UPI001F3BCFDB|nr:glycosyltransferase [Muricauda sp. SCSIO 65647]UJH67025.1 glycosyltransferase [Muricauda sp. SCSIO 65647]
MNSKIDRQPRLAFLLGIASGNGGIARVTSIIANQFIKKGFENLSIIGYLQQNIEDVVYEWNDKISFFDLLPEQESMTTGIFKAVPKLRKLLKKEKVDILICCGHIFGPLAVLATFGTKTNLIYWSHTSFYGVDNKYKFFNEQFTSLFADVVVPLTKTDEKNYQKKTWAKKVVQIYNPVDDRLLETNKEYQPDTFKIVSVGRLAKSKNFHSHLLEIAAKVFEKNIGYTWHIYGKGEMQNAIEAKIEEYGLENKVILEGNVNNLYDLYTEHSILVMTSSFEGFPMSLLEGMAKKLPLVSFDVPTGPNEIINNNENGFLISPFNTTLMAKKIEELILDKKKRISFSKANTKVIQDFKMEHIMNRWMGIIKDFQ